MCPIFCSTTTQKHVKKKPVSSAALQAVPFLRLFSDKQVGETKSAPKHTLLFNRPIV